VLCQHWRQNICANREESEIPSHSNSFLIKNPMFIER
jgi:hypothetical protein